MRQIGRIPSESSAIKFRDFLYLHGIDNDIEFEPDGAWAVWVHDEELLDKAKAMLGDFLNNSKDQKYDRASLLAQKERQKAEEVEQESKHRYVEARQLWPSRLAVPLGRVTLVLIILSVLITLLGGLGNNQAAISGLFISYTFGGPFFGLEEVGSGQIWRLITPIFIHLGLLHLIFDMYWLKEFGAMVEFRKGSRFLLSFVLVTALASNLGQYVLEGPNFGGMSGVIYALFGYIWMQGKFNPAAGLHLETTTIWILVGWFFFSLFLLDKVANGAHGVGLVAGMLWGIAAVRLRR